MKTLLGARSWLHFACFVCLTMMVVACSTTLVPRRHTVRIGAASISRFRGMTLTGKVVDGRDNREESKQIRARLGSAVSHSLTQAGAKLRPDAPTRLTVRILNLSVRSGHWTNEGCAVFEVSLTRPQGKPIALSESACRKSSHGTSTALEAAINDALRVAFARVQARL